MRLEVRRVSVPLRAPLRAAWGELRARELLEVRLDDGAGGVGLGEAAPLEPYDGVSLAAARAALDAYSAVLADAGPDDEPPALLAACRAERDLPPALAAVDLALWDRAGRRARRPVAALLHPGAADHVEVAALIGAEDRAGAAAAAAAAAREGFRTVKVKVGVGDDAGRLAAVRAAAGPGVAIRVDANGAWDEAQALAALSALAPAGIELCEEPVRGVDALRRLRRRSPIPVALDESGAEPGAPGSGAADVVCLKLSRSGGLSALLRDAAAARAAGAAIVVTSTWDGPLGVAAGLHAAAALAPDGGLLACGLATLRAFAVFDPFAPRDGRIAVPTAPGLGHPGLAGWDD